MEIKQAIYHLEKALKQTTAQNSLQVQLQQLNAKINTLLQKQDTATNTTQKVVFFFFFFFFLFLHLVYAV